MSTEHPEFPLEQQHINRAATALQTMQETERAKARRAGVGGSMRMAERALRELAESRLERLLDAEAGVCFGRIYAEDDRDWHIGLQHINEGEETLVISFETEIGGKFAAATAEDPQGLRSRRRLTVADGTRLVSVRDEMLDGSDPRPGYTDDAILEALEADRSGEMRHIAATIERHQNRLIRFDRSGVLVVQGGPGTGKTAVALHRASWLAFTFAGSLGDTGGILVVGPNPTFMSYIQSVLPGLGKRHIAQMDVERLAPVRGRSREAPEIATLKGDARMARVLRQAAFSRVQPPHEDTVIRVGSRQIPLPPDEVAEAVRRSRRGRRSYMDGREDFRRRAGELLVARLRSASDADAARAMLRQQSGAWFNFIQRVWPAMSAEQLLHDLYTVERRRRHGADGVLSDTEGGLLARPGAKRPGDQRWTRADAVLLDEAEYVLRGRNGGWRYVIVDEAQDLTPMQLRMVGRRSSTGDLTLVGDLGQATGPHRYGDWHEILGHIASKKPASIEELARGYRVPEEILDYASQLLPAIAPGLAPTKGLRPADGFWVTSTHDAPAAAAGDVAEILESETGTIGVIAAESMLRAVREELDEAGVEYGTGQKALRTRVSLLAATDAKGLEFDHVIVVEPAAIAADGPQGLAELYVVLTRPTRSLSVWHVDPLPAGLG
jgi:DNA helicase IV